MYGTLAGKSDFMGGIFDRWINIIPESAIFNKYLLPKISNGKKVEIITDFYKYAETYPNSKKGAIANAAGMLYRFAHEVQIGDYVAFPSKSDRQINLGVIEGEYHYNPNAHEYVQQRKVKWIRHIPRTAFSQGALYEIGSAMSFFMIKNYADEYLAAFDTNFILQR